MIDTQVRFCINVLFNAYYLALIVDMFHVITMENQATAVKPYYKLGVEVISQ